MREPKVVGTITRHSEEIGAGDLSICPWLDQVWMFSAKRSSNGKHIFHELNFSSNIVELLLVLFKHLFQLLQAIPTILLSSCLQIGLEHLKLLFPHLAHSVIVSQSEEHEDAVQVRSDKAEGYQAVWRHMNRIIHCTQ